MDRKNLSLLLSPKKRLKIQSKKGKTEYFTLNKIQRQILKYIVECWEQKKQAKLIIIKGRQQGVTTLFQILALALVLKVPGFKAYTMAHDRSLANDIFENKIKFAFDQLPENFRSLYTTNRNNARQLLFDGEMQKSSVTVGLSGRGGTYQMLHISEPGMMSTLGKIWSEMQSGTLPAGEFADIIAFESTADGGLGPFYQFTKSNMSKGSEYHVMFLSWTDTDEYRKTPPTLDHWKAEYKQIARDYKLELDPVAKYGLSDDQWFWYFEKAKQLRDEVKVQYPLSLDEAFISLAQNYFNIRKVQEAEEKAKTVQYEEWKGFQIFKKPMSGHIYAVGGDCATGEGGDNSSIHVIDATTGEQVAVATGKFDEPTMAKMMCDVGYAYNEAYIAPEINNMGRAVMYFIIQYGYPDEKLFKRIKDDPSRAKERIGNYGWLTTSVTRPVLLADFRNAFEDGTIKINDVETLREMLVFVNNNGKYEAQVGCNDDRVLGAMIAWQVVQYIVEFG